MKDDRRDTKMTRANSNKARGDATAAWFTAWAPKTPSKFKRGKRNPHNVCSGIYGESENIAMHSFHGGKGRRNGGKPRPEEWGVSLN